MNKSPRITLVGAGPGDPDLLTLKGARALAEADVVLYDALANRAILELAPHARKIHVGKRAGKHSRKQEDIQFLMVQYAYRHGHVVRLKGGDPFVFGRGHEELEYAKAFGIPAEVVPGISSAIAVPAAQGVPVTRRSVAESFWVVTATTKEGKLSEDLALAVQSSATIVILMGLRKLPQITRLFRAAGKAQVPALVVQNGTLPNERKVLGTIDTIEEQVAQAKLGTPALIIVGETVKLHAEYVKHYAMLGS